MQSVVKGKMPISVIGRKNNRQSDYPALRGFTLLEILVVVFVIGLAASVVTLTINRSPDSRIKKATEQLYNNLSLAQEEAVLQNNWLGLRLERDEDRTGYNRYRWLFSTDEAQTWQQMTSQFFSDVQLGESLQIILEIEDGIEPSREQERLDSNLFFANPSPDEDEQEEKRPQEPPPHIIFYPDGGSDPFTITVNHQDGEGEELAIVGDALGRLTIPHPDE